MALLKEWVFKSFAEKVAALESAGPQCLVQARRAQLAGSFEPGSAASRRGRLRVLHGELSRALTFGLFVARRPLREPLSSSHFRPLRCEAEASAAGALAPRGWRAPSSLA